MPAKKKSGRTYASAPATTDQALWALIRQAAHALSFEAYSAFVDGVLTGSEATQEPADAYKQLERATHLFVADRGSVALTADSRVDPHLFANKDDAARLGPELGERSGAEELENLFKAYLVSVEVSEGDRLDVIPYLARLRPNLPSGAPLLREDLTSPCMIELIWSYWHEQGLLAETMRAISLRFQNKRIRTDYDPLAVFELSHLQPLNSLL